MKEFQSKEDRTPEEVGHMAYLDALTEMYEERDDSEESLGTLASLRLLFELAVFIVRDLILGRLVAISLALMSIPKVRFPEKFTLRKKGNRVAAPPGSRLFAFVDFFYSSKTVNLTFLPILADWRTEYYEALKQGRLWKARWISVRYRYSFVAAMGPRKVLDFVRSFTSAGR
jgi:hypothetical protein